MARVVEQRREQPAVLACDPRDDERVVGAPSGLYPHAKRSASASQKSRFAASAQRPVPYVTHAGCQLPSRLEQRGDELLGQVLDVGLDQLAAGLVRQLAS